MAKGRLTLFIIVGMVLGLVVGAALHSAFPAKDPTLLAIADYLKLLADVFLKLIKMIIAPLVLATIVTGIAGMGDSAALGRIGGRALAWFVTASVLLPLNDQGLRDRFTPIVGLDWGF